MELEMGQSQGVRLREGKERSKLKSKFINSKGEGSGNLLGENVSFRV